MHIRVYVYLQIMYKKCIYKDVLKENCKIFIVTNMIFISKGTDASSLPEIMCPVCLCVCVLSVHVAVSTLNCVSENLDVCMFALGSLAPAHYIFMSHAV